MKHKHLKAFSKSDELVVEIWIISLILGLIGITGSMFISESNVVFVIVFAFAILVLKDSIKTLIELHKKNIK